MMVKIMEMKKGALKNVAVSDSFFTVPKKLNIFNILTTT
jgi:hypothetical protein